MSISKISRLGRNIQAFRKMKGLSQTELGTRVGISGDIVGRYERGSVNPSFNTIIKISEELEISLNTLVGQEDFTIRKELQHRLKQLDSLSDEALEPILVVMEAYIRDHKVKSAYR